MKPSLMEGLREPSDAEETAEGESSGADSGAAWEELRKRFLEGDPAESQDAFRGLTALCEEEKEAGGYGKKPALHVMIGAK